MKPSRQHRRRGRIVAALLVALAAGGGTAIGQPKDDPLKRPRIDTSLPGAPVGGVMQQQTRPFYVQGAVVALLTAGAVWAVCHSSRRQ
jgi:hypothetical protein